MNSDTTGRPGSEQEGAEGLAADLDHDLADELADQVRRLADRLRSLSDARLARPLPPAGSRADAAHALAQRLADDTAALAGEPARAVPRLNDLAVGDQVAVTGADFVREIRRAAPQAARSRARAAIEAVRTLRAAL